MWNWLTPPKSRAYNVRKFLGLKYFSRSGVKITVYEIKKRNLMSRGLKQFQVIWFGLVHIRLDWKLSKVWKENYHNNNIFWLWRSHQTSFPKIVDSSINWNKQRWNSYLHISIFSQDDIWYFLHLTKNFTSTIQGHHILKLTIDQYGCNKPKHKASTCCDKKTILH